MTELATLAERFEPHRAHLRGVAYRMLGSLNDSDDAVQEAWLRLARSDADSVHNLGGWLTTVVSRVCLDMLRSRTARREDVTGQPVPSESPGDESGDPEPEALLVDEVGRALLVVLDTLSPAERVAFVLHDGFGVPFSEIAPVVGRDPGATKKLASRARLKVRGKPAVSSVDLGRHRAVVETFLAASRSGDVDAVVSVLDPDVVRRADRVAIPVGRPAEVRGARNVTREIVSFGRNARFAAPALVDGDVGIVVAPGGRLRLVIRISVVDDRIRAYEMLADPETLGRLHIAVLDQ